MLDTSQSWQRHKLLHASPGSGPRPCKCTSHGGNSRMCDKCSYPWPRAQKTWVWGSMLCCHCLAIINTSMFEFVICKGSVIRLDRRACWGLTQNVEQPPAASSPARDGLHALWVLWVPFLPLTSQGLVSKGRPIFCHCPPALLGPGHEHGKVWGWVCRTHTPQYLRVGYRGGCPHPGLAPSQGQVTARGGVLLSAPGQGTQCVPPWRLESLRATVV